MAKYIRDVDFVTLDLHEGLKPVPDAYMFRADRPARWLQRTCLWILSKLGATAQISTTEVRRVRLDGEGFMARLYAQKRELFDQFGYDASTLLIGSEEYEQLMGSPEVYQLMRFTAPYELRGQVFGLNVRVVPWMSGMVVLPTKWI
jgi:hypothetical protein